MKSERIMTFWKVGYFKLFDSDGNASTSREVSLPESDWQRLLWRFYWRQS